MRKHQVRIVDMANELNLSPSTVSRALKDNTRISVSTRQAVKELAKRWGFRPNPHALSLLNSRTNTLGLIIPEFTLHFFSRALNGVEEVASQNNYRLMTCTSRENYEKEKKAVQTLMDNRVDGFLISYSNSTTEYEHLMEIKELGIPLVFIDRLCEDIDTSYVITDDFEGSKEGVSYLISTGCKKIAILKGPEDIPTTFSRYMGYAEAMKMHDLEIEENLVIPYEENDELRRIALEELFEEEFDAVFAYNDYLAYEVVTMAREKGKSIPEDFSVLGYADEPVASFSTPKISTVKQPAFEMGRRAAKLLIDQLADQNTDPYDDPKDILLKTTLVIRETTRKVS